MDQGAQTQSMQKVQEIVPPDEDLLKRDKLFVTIKSPDSMIFSGEAVAISSVNDVGPFDVLPRHENFISILTQKIVIFQDKSQKKEMNIEKGIIKARQNRVQIFLGIETLGKSETIMFQNAEVSKTAEVMEKEADK